VIVQPNLRSAYLRPNMDGVALTLPAKFSYDRPLSLLDWAQADHNSEESLVADPRASLTPAEMVERKLVTLLRSNALPISHVQMLYTGMSRR
jgi:hypothetical protein